MPDVRSATMGGSQQHEATAGYFGPLRSARYLLLTTFRPDAIPVSTRVPGVVDGDRAFFRVRHRSGTARRLRHTDDVQVTACPVPGLTMGLPLDAVARLLSGAEASRAAERLARKYRLRQHVLIPLLHRTRRWQLAYYELLSYAAAADADAGQHQRADRGPIQPSHT